MASIITFTIFRKIEVFKSKSTVDKTTACGYSACIPGQGHVYIQGVKKDGQSQAAIFPKHLGNRIFHRHLLR